MLIVKSKSLFLLAALSGGFCMLVAGSVVAEVVTTRFQNGMDGYTGTFDRWIGEREQDNQDGSAAASDFMDGYAKDSSPDVQALLRFDNIIGSDPGQIPTGATVLSAELIVTTGVRGNAQTGGPYGVAGMLQPFDSTTVYYDFISETDMIGPLVAGRLGNTVRGRLRPPASGKHGQRKRDIGRSILGGRHGESWSCHPGWPT